MLIQNKALSNSETTRIILLGYVRLLFINFAIIIMPLLACIVFSSEFIQVQMHLHQTIGLPDNSLPSERFADVIVMLGGVIVPFISILTCSAQNHVKHDAKDIMASSRHSIEAVLVFASCSLIFFVVIDITTDADAWLCIYPIASFSYGVGLWSIAASSRLEGLINWRSICICLSYIGLYCVLWYWMYQGPNSPVGISLLLLGIFLFPILSGLLLFRFWRMSIN